MKKAKTEIAKDMKKGDEPMKKIIKYTGLNRERIVNL
jgi:hypothetical protein